LWPVLNFTVAGFELLERLIAGYVCHVAYKRVAAMTRARAEEYRRLAEECLTTARTVSTEEARAALIERAEFWSRLAKEQDDESPDIAVPPTAAGESQPVAQQQQQV
jgi:hypothetical protein